MKKLMFDYGHGGKDSGATLGNRKEKDDVLKLGQDVKKEVIRHGVIVNETRKNDTYVSLQQRCNLENQRNYDFFISFHRNAFDGTARGFEIYTYVLKKTGAVKMANSIRKNIKPIGFIDRGTKSQNFKVLRSTRADAVLMEVGFLDNVQDNNLYDSKYNEIVKCIAKGILEAIGIRYKEKESKPESKSGFYRVVCGSYKNKDNAKRQMEKLKKKGFDSFLTYYEK